MNTKNITFSVIMPCYNSEAYVRNALDSIVGQTYPHWELVAINDGSFDSTLDILSEYAKDEPRIKIYSKENGGYCSAVNMGLDHVTGDYFLMLGSDDRLATDLFEKLTDSIDSELPDVLTFRAMKIKDGQEVGLDELTTFATPCVKFNTSLIDYSNTYPDHSKILFERDTSKCFKREKLGDLRYFGKYGFDADGVFSMLFCHKATSFISLPTNGYLWTLREDSLSAKKLPLQKLNDCIYIWNCFFMQLLYNTSVNSLSTQEERYLRRYMQELYNIVPYTKFLIKNYRLFKDAAKTIKKTINHFSLEDLKPKRFFFLSHFPLLYSLLFTVKHTIIKQ